MGKRAQVCRIVRTREHTHTQTYSRSRLCEDWVKGVYLVRLLFLAEGHQNDRDKQIQYHKCHKNYAGPNEKGAKNGAIIQNLRGRKPVIPLSLSSKSGCLS